MRVTTGQVAPSDVAALAAFVKAAGWQCLYSVNLGGVAYGATTPELAAEEVAYAAQQFGGSLLGVEIGNEPDLYGYPDRYFADDWSLSKFLTSGASSARPLSPAHPTRRSLVRPTQLMRSSLPSRSAKP